MNSDRKHLLSFFLFAGASQLLLALLYVAYILLGKAEYFISYPLYLLHSVLVSVFLAIVLGLSLLEAVKGNRKNAFYILLIASGANLLGGLFSLSLQALIYESPIGTLDVLLIFGNMLDKVAIPVLFLFAVAYIPFLRKQEALYLPETLFDFTNRFSLACAVSASALTLYNLIGQIVNTVGFVRDSFGLLNNSEILTILLDFLLVFIEGFLLYFFTLLAVKRAEAYQNEEEDDEEE